MAYQNTRSKAGAKRNRTNHQPTGINDKNFQDYCTSYFKKSKFLYNNVKTNDDLIVDERGVCNLFITC